MPIIFALIIVVCLAFLISHQLLTRRLHNVERAFALLEDKLRDRLDLMVEWAESSSETEDELPAGLKELRETARDGEAGALIKAYVKIEKLFRPAEPDWEPLKENENELRELGKKYNSEVEPYNAMLSKFPWKLYAAALMIKKEERFKY